MKLKKKFRKRFQMNITFAYVHFALVRGIFSRSACKCLSLNRWQVDNRDSKYTRSLRISRRIDTKRIGCHLFVSIQTV